MRLCEVEGCGRKHRELGWCHSHAARVRRGEPVGGPFPETPLERFTAKIEVDGDCWIWQAGTDGDGRYGLFKIAGTRQKMVAHRWAYLHLAGLTVPDGLVLDHLCRRTLCVNPDHVEPVTQRENILRGGWGSAKNARKTHCKYGHEFTPDNITPWGQRRGVRICATCHDEYNARRSVARRSEDAA